MKRARFGRLLSAVMIVVWLALVLVAFYAVQKPFTRGTVTAVMRSGLDLATAGLVTVLGAAIGRRVLHWLRLGDLSSGDLVWLAPGLGLGALALLTFALGLAGAWRGWVVYGLVALLAALFARDLAFLARRLGAWRPKLAVGRWGQAYLLATLTLTLLLALAPPTSWDGLFYHLTGPALYIDQAAISPLDIDIPHLAFPSLMEMVYGLAMLLRGDVAAKLLHLAFGLLLAALTYRLSERWYGREVAGWSLLLLVSTPMVTVLAAWAYNDLALAFYQLGALYGLLAWQRQQRTGWLAVAGLMSGFALGLKYTAFPIALVGLVYVVWRSKDRWSGVVTYAAPMGLAAAPWYLRNWVFTGNPVYPFVFGGRNWDAFRAAWYAHAGTGIGWRPLRILSLPVTMTLGLRDVNYYDGRTGPLFLALTPVLLWSVVRAWRERGRPTAKDVGPRAAALLGGFVTVCAITWSLGAIQSRSLFQARLFLPGLVALIPLLSQGLVRLTALDLPRFSISTFVRLTMGLVLALGLVNHTLDVLRLEPLRYLVGYESRSDYLRRVLGDYHRAMGQLPEVVPEDGRVLFLWEPRSYHSPRPAQPDPILDNWGHLRHRLGTNARIAAHLREEGYSHVLLNRRGLDFVVEEGESPLAAADVERLRTFVEQYLALTTTNGSYELYELQG